jgi:two-component system response regulator
MSESVAPIKVLLVEDNPGDADLTREAFEESRLLIDLRVATDGVAAMQQLRAEHPDLILLDLNLPRKNGTEVLAEIRADPELKHIPVVVLTSSTAEQDVVKSYQLGANCYVTKPVDLQAFQTIISQTGGFWFTVVRLPTS